MTDHATRLPFDPDEADQLAALGVGGRTSARRLPVCPDPAVVLALDEGVLDPAVADWVRAHVAACPACRRAAGDLARMFDEPASTESQERVDRLVAAGLGSALRRRPLAVWLVPAGGLALAAAIVLMVLSSRPSPPVPETQIAHATPPPLPSAFVVDRPVMPPPDVELPVRGEAETKASVPDQIASALDRADAGDVTGALARLEALARTHAGSAGAALALGAVQLRASGNTDAVATLERARTLKTDPQVRQEVDWFLSIALVRTDARDRARPLLDALCKAGGSRATQACAGLAELDRTGRR